jgi:2-hydroxy-3-keto-5-methylthiopentenyl-1-phosphate phosphatase
MKMKPTDAKTLVQCDFDGTITEEDISFLILDAFAKGDWRQWLDRYRQAKISVSRFNIEAFTMVKEDKPTLDCFVREKARIRPGFNDLLSYSRQRGFRFTIVSNGLGFYISTILDSLATGGVEVFAAQAVFEPDGIKTRYLGPDGVELDEGFKEAYARYFLEGGYKVVFIGNGVSDIPSARLANHVFATGPLLEHCRQAGIKCAPFVSLTDVVRGLEHLA